MMQGLPERGNEERQGMRASQGSRRYTVLWFGRTVGVGLAKVSGLQLHVHMLELASSVTFSCLLEEAGPEVLGVLKSSIGSREGSQGPGAFLCDVPVRWAGPCCNAPGAHA